MHTFYELSKKKTVLSIRGKDATSFLQGQVSCDVTEITDQQGKLGTMSNPKGRVICIFHLVKQSDTYYLIVNSGLSNVILDRFNLYKFRADVEINDISEEVTVLGHDTASRSFINDQLTPLASIHYGTTSTISLTLFKNTEPQCAIIKSDPSIKSDETGWDKILISSCLPEITPESSELFIPQMLNLDLLGGISFKKGCYTGQEVIARLHYKGTVKRRLFSFKSNLSIPAGKDILACDDKNSIGTVVNCVENTNSGFIGTIVIKNTYMNIMSINCEQYGEIIIIPPPYPLG